MNFGPAQCEWRGLTPTRIRLGPHSVVTAPIIGTTSLDKLKELIGKSPTCFLFSLSLRFGDSSESHDLELNTDVVDVKLSEEEVKHLEEPYRPMPVIGHA